MPIQLITNFDVNRPAPIDSRMVATNSNALSEIKFPYEGLTVYSKQQKMNYTYNGTTFLPSSNGIYGASGSLAGTTDVSIGSVGSIPNDKSFEFILSASSSLDRVQYSTFFMRNLSNDDATTVELRNQVKYVDNSLGIRDSSYISFNKQDTKKGIISFGTPTRLNDGTTVERFRIEPDSTSNNGAVVIVASTYSRPFYFSQTSALGTFIAFNYDGTSKIVTGTGSSIVQFTDAGDIIFTNFNQTTTPITQLSINRPFTNRTSDIQIRVDQSGFDMGSNVTSGYPRDFQLRTIPEIIRNIEHRYTKLQSLGHVTLADARLVNNILLLSGDGNFFTITLEKPIAGGDRGEIIIINPEIWNIRVRRPYTTLSGQTSNSDVDLPDGTEVTIRFLYTGTPPTSSETTRISIQQNNLSQNSGIKIYSSYTDTPGGEYITILDKRTTGDIFTFRRASGNWYVTNLNRESEISALGGGSLTWTAVTAQSPIQRIRYRSEPSPSYLMADVTGTTLTLLSSSAIASPVKFKWTESSYIGGFISSKRLEYGKVAGGNLIYLRGSFRLAGIPGASLNKAYDNGLGNKIWIGNIGDSFPTDISEAWGVCDISMTGSPLPNTNAGLAFTGRMNVDEEGRVFVQFYLMFVGAFNFTGTYTIDVNVPTFSWKKA
jgi:hypothetical protein